MTDRPILFSAPMVRAILADRKTQTRRVMRTNHVGYRSFLRWDGRPHTRAMMACSNGDPGRPESSVFCEDNRIGVPGDRLWVRETWSPWSDVVDCDEAAKLRDARAQMPWACVLYGADRAWSNSQPSDNGGRWRPSIHMPRWASRLTLDVVSVRVERLQAITEEDALAEGVSPAPFCKSGRPPGLEHVEAYEDLWTAINGKRAPWARNPWVWVVEFTRVTEGATAP